MKSILTALAFAAGICRDTAAQACYPIRRTMPKTANCRSDGKTGFRCR